MYSEFCSYVGAPCELKTAGVHLLFFPARLWHGSSRHDGRFEVDEKFSAISGTSPIPVSCRLPFQNQQKEEQGIVASVDITSVT